jgi:hypothetical protein
MATRGRRITVGTTATKLTGATDDSSALIRHRGTAPTDVGGSDVAVGAGFQLDVGDSLPADLGKGDDLYGIVASGTQRIDVLETSR